MAKVAAITVLIFFFIASCAAVTKTCNLYTGLGCTNSGVADKIRFFSTGLNNVPNSLCRKTYRLIIRLTGSDKGYRCTFTMDKPEYGKYIYSISHSSTATGSTSTSPYVYGRGLDSSWRTKTSPAGIYAGNNHYFNRIHTHPEDNHYSTITYTVENFKMRVYGSAGTSTLHANPNWFRPTISRSYIGLNRRYANTVAQGSGLCIAKCNTF